MRFYPARMLAGIFCVVFLLSFLLPSFTFAQTSSSNWIEDAEVTFVGRSAVRAKDFLDWTINPQNANWVFVTPNANINQLTQFWVAIRNISYALTLIIVLTTAFLLIISRGQSIHIRRQLLTIGAVFLLITFSFAFIEFFYRLIDTVQGFFLTRPNPTGITTNDLLNIAFQYNFKGYRLNDPATEEAAKVSIFLVKATSITYYAMATILLIRKIILWFFIILSPLWVLLLPFPFIRNTAKIWMGEFFRWLFYGPLFAVLLSGLVTMWKAKIPLNFNVAPGPTNVTYPTAISILLGGPGEQVGLQNSVNNVNTFANYAVALLMLWVVIILPFILLKIFRDVIAGIFKEDNAFFQKAFGAVYPFMGRPPPAPTPYRSPPPGTPQPTPPKPSSGEGLAQEMLLHRASEVGQGKAIPVEITNLESLPQVKTADIVKYAGLAIPKLTDLARMEMQKESVSQNKSLLRNIAAPTAVSNTYERSRFSSIQQELLSRSKRGDLTASTILAAAESARTGKPIAVPMGSRTGAREGPVPLVVGGGRTSLSQKQGAPITGAKPQVMPVINRIQTVGIDDYEDVKKMWEDNYRSGDIPVSDKVKSRTEWIKQDITKIESVIEMLSSIDEQKKREGLESLAVILPFLLLGGFSDAETTIYLKAKLEAAKKVLSELEQKVSEEDKVLIGNKKEKEEELTMEAKLATEPEDDKPTLADKLKGSETQTPTDNKTLDDTGQD